MVIDSTHKRLSLLERSFLKHGYATLFYKHMVSSVVVVQALNVRKELFTCWNIYRERNRDQLIKCKINQDQRPGHSRRTHHIHGCHAWMLMTCLSWNQRVRNFTMESYQRRVLRNSWVSCVQLTGAQEHIQVTKTEVWGRGLRELLWAHAPSLVKYVSTINYCEILHLRVAGIFNIYLSKYIKQQASSLILRRSVAIVWLRFSSIPASWLSTNPIAFRFDRARVLSVKIYSNGGLNISIFPIKHCMMVALLTIFE